MRRLLIVAACLIAVSAGAAHDTNWFVGLTNTATGIWPANEGTGTNAYDKTPGGNHAHKFDATLTPAWSNRTGAGSALLFAGADNRSMVVSNSAPFRLGTNGYIIATWCNITGDGVLLSKGGGAANWGSGGHEWMVYYSATVWYFFVNKAGTATYTAYTLAETPGVWTHVAAVADGLKNYFFRNGVEVTNIPYIATTATSDPQIFWFGRAVSGSDSFSGGMQGIFIEIGGTNTSYAGQSNLVAYLYEHGGTNWTPPAATGGTRIRPGVVNASWSLATGGAP